jgi:hypothetical protein
MSTEETASTSNPEPPPEPRPGAGAPEASAGVGKARGRMRRLIAFVVVLAIGAAGAWYWWQQQKLALDFSGPARFPHVKASVFLLASALANHRAPWPVGASSRLTRVGKPHAGSIDEPGTITRYPCSRHRHPPA